MLRLYLPFHDPQLDDGHDIVRWSQYADVAEEPASLNWFEAAARVADERPAVRDLVSCMGELDADTAAALREVVGDTAMRCLRWVGYAENDDAVPSVRVHGEDYFEADLDPDEDLQAGRRVPEFAWDRDGRLAWGGRLYPDSLIIAADVSVFRQLHQDPRVDTASVRTERDLLPGSAGD
jgi:hypothetical protein